LTDSKTVLTLNHDDVLDGMEGINMKAVPELRNGERFHFKTPVLIEDERTGYRYDGTMFNYSRSGMYLETEYAPRPERKIKIKVNRLPDLASPRKYYAEVRWRKPLPDKGSSYAFGMGVKYY